MNPSRRRALLAGLLLPPALAGCGGPAIAQRGAIGALPDLADLAERVLPAVVAISVQSEGPQPVPPEFRGTPLERYFRGRRERSQGAGSGFVIDPAGFIVTNNHVVGNASRVTVSLQNGQELTARVVGSDELMDLALLRVMGARPSTVFGTILIEGLLIAAIGALGGIAVAHGLIALASANFPTLDELGLSAMRFLPGEGGILVAALAIGLVAALIPAIRIFRVDLATTLARYS